MMSQFEVNNISKFYGSSKVLSNVSFSVNAGEAFGIIGLSGAGKSTILRCLSGLETLQEGLISCDGISTKSMSDNELKKYRSAVGVVFQGYNLLFQRTVFGNIAFPLELKNVNKDAIKKRVAHLIDLVGLKGKENSYIATLSGGQRQRVAIARAIATNIKVLLLDEVTSALDPMTTKSIIELLRKINKNYGVTLILVTHEMSVVRALCDRVAVLNYGEIVETGRISEVLDNPQNEITKLLLGKEI